jgi:hypothetical protein
VEIIAGASHAIFIIIVKPVSNNQEDKARKRKDMTALRFSAWPLLISIAFSSVITTVQANETEDVFGNFRPNRAATAPAAPAAKPAAPPTAATPPAANPQPATAANADAPKAAAAAPAEPEAPAKTAAQLSSEIWDAARSGNTAAVQAALQEGANPNSATHLGETAMHAAVAVGSLSTVIALKNAGGNINAVTSNGWTPLHHAARFRRADIANYLRTQGANSQAYTRDNPPKTPLQMALDNGDMRIARILGY